MTALEHYHDRFPIMFFLVISATTYVSLKILINLL